MIELEKTLRSGRYIEGTNTPEEKGTMKDKSTLHRKYVRLMMEKFLQGKCS